MNGMVKSNDVFDRLTAIKEVAPGDWECVCICGTKTIVRWHLLVRRVRKSCGCLKRNVLGDATRKHGMANSHLTGYASRTYGVWQAMRDRCKNKNRKDYRRYGGRGIKVCQRWDSSFENFLLDMGEPPEGHTLDRINNDGDYSPENCRWATRKEQVYNSSCIRWITIDGTTRSLAEWVNHFGITKSTFYRRLKKGLTEVSALTGDAK
jgi:hypothetical protein